MGLERFEVDKSRGFYPDFLESAEITEILEILEILKMILLSSEITEILEILDTLDMEFSEEWFVLKIASKCWVKSRMGVIFFPSYRPPFYLVSGGGGEWTKKLLQISWKSGSE